MIIIWIIFLLGTNDLDISKHNKVIPYRNIEAFYDEYEQNSAQSFKLPENVASLTTFRRAFNYCAKEKGIRKLRCKGNMSTCEICNNSDELLNNKSKCLPNQREIIHRFKKVHMNQQFKEREYLDQRKIDALKVDDNGDPIEALIFPDGMTQHTCKTPKFDKPSKGDSAIESRIVSSEVYIYIY